MKEHGVPDSRLTVIKKDLDNPKPCEYWLCQCECGNLVSVKRENLIRQDRNGTRSCGCMHQEVVKRFCQIHYNDLTNHRFGKLVCIKPVGSDKYKYTRWLCQCDCGNTCIRASRDLLDGNVKSCGCLKSFGETVIHEWLTKNNYDFEREVKFDDLKYKQYLRFDFKVYTNNGGFILIEYQGPQHYDKNNIWYSEKGALRDQMKRDYCKANNIPLFEIKDTKEEKIIEILNKILKGDDDL